MSRTKTAMTIAMGGWVSRVLTLINNLVLIPIVIIAVGAENYGYWLASGGILAWLSIMDAGITPLIRQRVAYHAAQGDRNTADSYFCHGLIAYGLIAVLISATTYFLGVWIPGFLGVEQTYHSEFKQAIWLAGLSLALGLLINVVDSYLYAILRARVPVIAAALAQIVLILVTLYLLNDGHGVLAIAGGLVLSRAFLVLVLFGGLMGKYERSFLQQFRLRKAILKDYLSTTPIVLFARLGGQSTAKIEPLILVLFISPQVATGYVIAKKMIEILIGFSNTIRGAVSPGFSHFLGEKGPKEASILLSRVLQVCLAPVLIMVAIYITVNESFVATWIPGQWIPGYTVILLLGLEAIVISISQTVVQLVGACGNISYSSLAIFLEALIRVLCMFLCLKYFSYEALPLACILSGLLLLFFAWSRLRKNLGIVKFNYLKISSAFSLWACFGAFLIWSSSSFAISDGWFNLIIGAAIFGLLASGFSVITMPYFRERLTSLLRRQAFKLNALR